MSNQDMTWAQNEIAKASPVDEPTRGDYNGNADDDYSVGLDRGAWGLSQIARAALTVTLGQGPRT